MGGFRSDRIRLPRPQPTPENHTEYADHMTARPAMAHPQLPERGHASALIASADAAIEGIIAPAGATLGKEPGDRVVWIAT